MSEPDIIRGVPVCFPFKPYKIQRDFMEKVIECCQTGTNCMLESPTGTGKTLSLLCSSLAWLKMEKAEISAKMNASLKKIDPSLSKLNFPLILEGNIEDEGYRFPKIIFSSRTHSQLDQAIAELKRTKYADVDSAVLGSRDQLCINNDVLKETTAAAKNSSCRTLVKHRQCSYFSPTECGTAYGFREHGILDIEDLLEIGKELSTCPYYATKTLKDCADIIFMPYNYILDPRVRKANDVRLKNCVVILDEGHNVEKMCEDAASYEFTSSDIATCISEVTEVIDAICWLTENNFENLYPDGLSADELTNLKSVLLAFANVIGSVTVGGPDGSAELAGETIFEWLSRSFIIHLNFGHFMNLMERTVEYIKFLHSSYDLPPQVKAILQHTGSGLYIMRDLLETVFSMDGSSYEEHYESVRESYRLLISSEKKTYQRRVDNDLAVVRGTPKSVNFWCFNAGFSMKKLQNQGVLSIIITSGTLSPLPPLISELGIPIPVTLENAHVINNKQVYVGVLRSGPDGTPLNSSFKTRSNPTYLKSLGQTILNLARLVPHGLLVFFPSYSVMTQSLETWFQCATWDAISSCKEIFVEPKDKRELKAVMENYNKKIVEPGSKGACFFAVCRGKVSGEQWYALEATRAVNQAVGRVIRHRNDYGAILFCDARFDSKSIQSNLSQWIRPRVNLHHKFSTLPRVLAQFFRNARETLPQPEIKPILPRQSRFATSDKPLLPEDGLEGSTQGLASDEKPNVCDPSNLASNDCASSPSRSVSPPVYVAPRENDILSMLYPVSSTSVSRSGDAVQSDSVICCDATGERTTVSMPSRTDSRKRSSDESGNVSICVNDDVTLAAELPQPRTKPYSPTLSSSTSCSESSPTKVNVEIPKQRLFSDEEPDQCDPSNLAANDCMPSLGNPGKSSSDYLESSPSSPFTAKIGYSSIINSSTSSSVSGSDAVKADSLFYSEATAAGTTDSVPKQVDRIRFSNETGNDSIHVIDDAPSASKTVENGSGDADDSVIIIDEVIKSPDDERDEERPHKRSRAHLPISYDF